MDREKMMQGNLSFSFWNKRNGIWWIIFRPLITLKDFSQVHLRTWEWGHTRAMDSRLIFLEWLLTNVTHQWLFIRHTHTHIYTYIQIHKTEENWSSGCKYAWKFSLPPKIPASLSSENGLSNFWSVKGKSFVLNGVENLPIKISYLLLLSLSLSLSLSLTLSLTLLLLDEPIDFSIFI